MSLRPPPIHLGIRCVLILPQGSEASCPHVRFVHSTCPRPCTSLSPRAGRLFPSGRQARAARGPRAPVPVAILAAGQGLGGSDVLSRAEEAGHVADYEGGSDVCIWGAGLSWSQPLCPWGATRAHFRALPRSCEGSDVGHAPVA